MPVEDRLNSGLYLEMTDMDTATYATTRVPEVKLLTGVERASWWTNAQRDRTDLPRVLPEFTLLGVYEVGDDFDAQLLWALPAITFVAPLARAKGHCLDNPLSAYR